MGKYAVSKTKNNGFRFNLKSGNGEIIGTSEIYTTEAACIGGTESVKKNALIANMDDQTDKTEEDIKNPKFKIYLDKFKSYRFRLKARNGEIILSSESYTSKSSAKGGIEAVKNNADSPIEKQY